MSSEGWRVQALTPARAMEAPISFRNPRRPTGSSHSDAFCGNSRCRNSLNSGVPDRASRLRQYSRPRVPSRRARSASMSGRSFMSESPMARRTAGERVDAVLLHQLRTDHRLRDRWPVAHRRDFAAWPDVVLGVPVTVQAPLHLQRVDLLHQRHLIDATMTGLATHPLLHVNSVIEVDEVGQVVHTDPVKRLVVTEAGPNGLQNRFRGEQL